MGKLADIVISEADPLLDIGTMQKLDVVIVNGRLLGRNALDSLLAKAENGVRFK
jgi:imidazolonepropionase-like amidohydrolase